MARDEPMLVVDVTWSPAPREMRVARVQLVAGATAADAVRASGWADALPAITDPASRLGLAVWGQACEPGQPLRDGDRVEILRPLEIDPMDARRERYEAAGGVQALRRQREALQPKKKGRRTTSRSSA